MARIRSIKPEFWVDEKIVELSAFARLLFIGLWNFCDDDGRMEYREKKIKMQIFPADDLDISELFGELRRDDLVLLYSVDNKQFLQVQNFAKHQKIDKRSASKYPNPPESPRIPPEPNYGGDQGRDQGRDHIDTSEDASSQATPDPIPHKEIIDLYHKCFPVGQKVLLSRYKGSAREKQLIQRWRESPKHQTLDFWEQYFTAASQITWMTGGNNRNWVADFAYLTKRAGFDKTLEQVVGDG